MATITGNTIINLNLGTSSSEAGFGSYTIESSVKVSNDYANGGSVIIQGGFAGDYVETPAGLPNENITNRAWPVTNSVPVNQDNSASQFLQLVIQSPGSPYAPILTSNSLSTALYTQYYFSSDQLNIIHTDNVSYSITNQTLDAIYVDFSINDSDGIVNQDYLLGGDENDDINIQISPGLVSGTINAYFASVLANWCVINGSAQVMNFEIEEVGLTFSNATSNYDWINIQDYNAGTNVLTVSIDAHEDSGDRIGYIELFSTTNTSSQYNFRIGINQGPGMGVIVSGSTLNSSGITEVVSGANVYSETESVSLDVANVNAGFTTATGLQIPAEGGTLNFGAVAVGDSNSDLSSEIVPIGTVNAVPHAYGLPQGSPTGNPLLSSDETGITNFGGAANDSWLEYELFIQNPGEAASFKIEVLPNDTTEERNASLFVSNSLDETVTDTITISQAAGYNAESDNAQWLFRPEQDTTDGFNLFDSAYVASNFQNLGWQVGNDTDVVNFNHEANLAVLQIKIEGAGVVVDEYSQGGFLYTSLLPTIEFEGGQPSYVQDIGAIYPSFVDGYTFYIALELDAFEQENINSLQLYREFNLNLFHPLNETGLANDTITIRQFAQAITSFFPNYPQMITTGQNAQVPATTTFSSGDNVINLYTTSTGPDLGFNDPFQNTLTDGSVLKPEIFVTEYYCVDEAGGVHTNVDETGGLVPTQPPQSTTINQMSEGGSVQFPFQPDWITIGEPTEPNDAGISSVSINVDQFSPANPNMVYRRFVLSCWHGGTILAGQPGIGVFDFEYGNRAHDLIVQQYVQQFGLHFTGNYTGPTVVGSDFGLTQLIPDVTSISGPNSLTFSPTEPDLTTWVQPFNTFVFSSGSGTNLTPSIADTTAFMSSTFTFTVDPGPIRFRLRPDFDADPVYWEIEEWLTEIDLSGNSANHLYSHQGDGIFNDADGNHAFTITTTGTSFTFAWQPNTTSSPRYVIMQFTYDGGNLFGDNFVDWPFFVNPPENERPRILKFHQFPNGY